MAEAGEGGEAAADLPKQLEAAISAGQWPAAAATLQAMLAEGAFPAERVAPLLESLYRAGRDAEAMSLLSSVLAHPDPPPLLLDYLSVFLCERGEFSKAASLCHRALKADPKSVRLWRNLGAALLACGQTETALKALANAQKLAPDDPRAEHLASSQKGSLKTELLSVDPASVRTASLFLMMEPPSKGIVSEIHVTPKVMPDNSLNISIPPAARTGFPMRANQRVVISTWSMNGLYVRFAKAPKLTHVGEEVLLEIEPAPDYRIQRRREARLPAKGMIRAWIMNTDPVKSSLNVIDISTGGVAFETAVRADPNAQMEICFDFQKEKVHMPLTVRRLVPKGNKFLIAGKFAEDAKELKKIADKVRELQAIIDRASKR